MFTMCSESDIRAELIAMKTGVYTLRASIKYPDTETIATIAVAKVDDVNHIFVPILETDKEFTYTLDQMVSFIVHDFRDTFKNGVYGNLTSRRLAGSLAEYQATKPELTEFGIENYLGHPEIFIDDLSDGIYRIRGTTKIARANLRILFIKHDGILQRIYDLEDGSWSLVDQTSKSLINESILRFGGEYDIKQIRIPK